MLKVTKTRRVVGNPATRINGILGLTMNPAMQLKKGAKAMASTATKKKPGAVQKKKPAESSGMALVKHNPAKVMIMKHVPAPSKGKPKSQHNPGVGDIVVGAVVVIAAAVISKVGSQAVLGDKNTGVMGYAGNIAAGAALYFAARAAKASPVITANIAAGTAVQVVLRGINDFTPLGKYVNQLGMGDYQVQAFVTPQILKVPNKSAEIQIPKGWGEGKVVMMPPLAATAENGGGGMGSVYGNGRGGGLY